MARSSRPENGTVSELPWQLDKNYAQFCKYLRELVTLHSLSLTGVLEILRGWIGCDAVALVSGSGLSLTQRKARWEVHRLVARQGRQRRRLESGVMSDPFVLLLNRLADQANTGPEWTPLVDYQPPWRSAAGRKDWDEADALPNLSASEPLHEAWGKLACVCVGLLGHVTIGDWTLGESLLVAVNEEQAKQKGVRAISKIQMRPAFLAFCVYLAEVDSHFWRTSRVHRLPLAQRREFLRNNEDRQAYLRSAWRLAPLMGKDLPRVIDTLVEIDAEQGGDPAKSATGTFSVAEVRKRSLESYTCVEDNRRQIESAEKAARRARVEAMWEWAKLLHDASQMDLRKNTPKVVTEAHPGQWESDLQALVGRANELLAKLPAIVWPKRMKRLRLKPKTLAAFFLCRIVEWRKHGENAPDCVLGGAAAGRGQAERILFLQRLAVVAQFALGARPGDMDTFEALLWLVCEFGHVALGLDRRIDLERHLGLAARGQPALYGLRRFCRDHLHHVIQVCLAGWLLLEAKRGKKTLLDAVRDQMASGGARPSEEDVLRQWFLTGLLHDIGYVVEVGKGWGELLGLFEDEILEGIQAGIERELDVLTEHAVDFISWGFTRRDKPGEDHGVVSALHTRDLLKRLATHKDPGDFDQAVLAMAHHNHWRPEIDFAKEPLRVLLVLADELQEWDRPWLELDRVALALSAAAVFPGGRGAAWHEPIGKVYAHVEASWDKRYHRLRINCPEDVLTFELEYEADALRHDAIFSAWIGRASSLQRLKLDGCPLDFRYYMTNPVLPPAELTYRDPTETQMERLRRLVRDKRVWQVAAWLPKAARMIKGPGAPAVQYDCREKKERRVEELTLTVKALSTQRLILGDTEDFWRAAGEWVGVWEAREPTI